MAGIGDAGGVAIPIVADLGKQQDRHRIIETTQRELGPIDILVSNAAITYFEPVAEFEEKHYRLMFEVQVRAPFEMAQLVLPAMRERGSGWILNISSGAARHPQGPPYPARGGGGGTVYGMCKAALERFTTGLAAEVYDDGIAVNVLSPSGLVSTPGTVHHGLVARSSPDRLEPVEFMAEAAYALVTGDPATAHRQGHLREAHSGRARGGHRQHRRPAPGLSPAAWPGGSRPTPPPRRGGRRRPARSPPPRRRPRAAPAKRAR